MNVEIRSYGKSELAMLYFPTATKKNAVDNLARWINRVPELVKAFSAPGVNKRVHYFTRPQVELIFKYLDEP